MQSVSTVPVTRDLVLLGGGHTHALVLRKWAMAPLPGVQITVVNPAVKAPYTGMLPGFIAGHYTRAALDIDLVRLARQAGARLIIDRAIGLDTTQKRVQLAGRPDIVYDTLSIDIGITSHLAETSAADPIILPAKPLGPFADAWSALVDDARAQQRLPKIAVIGAGVAGVELALAMSHRLRSLDLGSPIITLMESGATPLRELNRSARKTLLAALDAAGIAILTQSGVADVDTDTTFVVSAAGATPQAWLHDTGLALDSGYITVNPHLQSVNTPDVFAVGDCAHLAYAPRPKAGVFAVRQAPALFDNLRAQLAGGQMVSYTPQRSYLKLISTGDTSAVTDKWGIGVSGRWVWRWKDRIDQRFMAQFRGRTAMAAPARPTKMAIGADALLETHLKACGGCGAKIAQTPLAEGLKPPGSAKVQFEDAAIQDTPHGKFVFSTDHLRAFSNDAATVSRVAAIHALGDIWAMGAQPTTVLAQIILPPLAADKQSAMLREITAAANSVFAACGTHIAGGHTSSGAELTIGFAIQGALARAPVLQSGARAGDKLVLTKPIGTGVLLAAEMQQLVDGDDYAAALHSMGREQGQAADLLAAKATAMTDVTGFGLAGHLLNILDASQTGARLDMRRIPLLQGALALSQSGLRSTLWPANAKQAERVRGTPSGAYDLLFDPQTGGGLLATIPAAALPRLIANFDTAQAPLWVIGEIVEGPSEIRCANEPFRPD